MLGYYEDVLQTNMGNGDSKDTYVDLKDHSALDIY
jgi:hypothetical protein